MIMPTPSQMIQRADLDTVNAAITVLCEFEAQNRGLVCDLASAMLCDLTTYGALGPLESYVKVYCDVLDGPDDVGPIVARILEGTHVDQAGRPQ